MPTNHHYRFSSRRRALGLIDILVIVSLIGLAIAILIPSMASWENNAGRRRTWCLANLKALTTSALTYAEAGRGVLPVAAHDPEQQGAQAQSATYIGDRPLLPDGQSDGHGFRNNGSSARGWHKLLQGGERAYMQPKQFICPNAKNELGHSPDGTRTMAFVKSGGEARWRFDTPDDPDGREMQVYDFDPTPVSDDDSQVASFSYSMHVTLTNRYGGVPLTNTQDPRLAFAADRSPYANKLTRIGNSGVARYEFDPQRKDAPNAETPGAAYSNLATSPRQRTDLNFWKEAANSPNHNRKGQNVAYLDGRAAWSNNPFAGADEDFLWSPQDPDQSVNPETGIVNPVSPLTYDYGHMRPVRESETDSVLIP